jgi:hypothetical protein
MGIQSAKNAVMGWLHGDTENECFRFSSCACNPDVRLLFPYVEEVMQKLSQESHMQPLFLFSTCSIS